jgi:4-diphosphocytidyl-2-C-methyl-D-erythritol kinase
VSGSPPPWPAPAKLNLFLHIVGRRADGYHELQTVFQFVDLCDDLHISVRDDGQIRLVEGAPGVPPGQDLCVRAARALKTASGSSRGADIRVVKRIPMGGGLGGGSSDAATCLAALNRLWGVGLSVDELAVLGLKLGADVPIFVRGRAAWAEGVGERLTALSPPTAPLEHNYLIIKPNVSVPTKDVFQDPELTRNSPPITIHGFLASGGGNDCLAVVRRRYPDVDRAMNWLSSFGEARLTGTGSCVFMVCEAARARQLLRQLPPEWVGYSVRGVNDSPLLSRLSVCVSSGAGNADG